jgi:hypothetical protein
MHEARLFEVEVGPEEIGLISALTAISAMGWNSPLPCRGSGAPRVGFESEDFWVRLSNGNRVESGRLATAFQAGIEEASEFPSFRKGAA